MRPTDVDFKAHHGRGTGRYTAELIKALGQYQGREELQVLPIKSNRLRASGFEKRLLDFVPAGKTTLENELLLPRRIERLGFDFIHFFAHGDAPTRCHTPYIVTVLDLIPLRLSELYRADKPNWRYRLARSLENKALTRAWGMLAISECTKRDVIEILGVPPEKIEVTPLAVGDEFYPRVLEKERFESCITIKKKMFGLPADRPVLLYVGGIDPRKNVPFLLECFAEVLGASSVSERPLLVMVGKIEKEREYPRLCQQIKMLDLADDVHLLGFLPDEMLPEIYQAAQIVLFPTLYEGFGFPLLEAMASGVPVLGSNNSSLPEVAGSIPCLLETGDREAWVREILDLLSSESRQRELGELGVKQAAQFSWSETAAKTYDAYCSFAEKLGRKIDSERISSEGTRAIAQ